MNKSFSILILFLCSFTFVATGCKHTPTENSNAAAILSLEDVSCTEAWLKLTVTNVNNPIVVLKRDTVVVDTLSLTTTDTTIADTGLLPSHTYTYTAQLLNGSWASNSTSSLTATTMDTTSHNFTWTSYTIGDASGGSSCLYDVTIINDTLAYAVGEFYRNDTAFNVAKWNGKEWSTMQLKYSFKLLFSTGSDDTLFGIARSIFAFGPDDIWIAAETVHHYNGEKWTEYAGNGAGEALKIWGSSSSDLYFVGNAGSIVHYNGSSWTSISSGTSLDVRSIWGDYNSKSGSYEIVATAGNPLISTERKILQISGTTVTTLSDNGTDYGFNSIWFSSGQYYWIVGGGVWEKHPGLSQSSWQSKDITSYTSEAVRGTALNDVLICGDYGDVLHFNGVTWKSYLPATYVDGIYYAVALKGNMCIVVGCHSPQAVAVVGKRN